MAQWTMAQIRAKLESERAQLSEIVTGMSREELLEPHASGWSAKDLLAHLTIAEGLNVKFARAMIALDQPRQLEIVRSDFPDYPHAHFVLDEFNAYMTDKLRVHSLDFVLAELARVRGETLRWLESLSEEQLDRRGLHAAWGEQTVRGVFRILAIHDKLHRDDLAKRKIPRE